MDKFFWLFLAVTTSCLINIPSQALPTPRTQSTNTKSSVRIITQSKATGTQAQLQTVEVWPGHGVSISFYETGEVIQRVWLDDPSLKQAVWDINEGDGTASTAIFFRICRRGGWFDLGCSPYFIGPFPFFIYQEKSPIFLGTPLTIP